MSNVKMYASSNSNEKILDENDYLMIRCWRWFCFQAKHYRAVLISALVVGALTYAFAFTNKLVNFDDVNALFRKGASLTSGRWGLDYISWLFPDYSMPWIYGVIGIALVTAAACIVVSIFEIRHPLLQALMTGLMVSSPTVIGTSTYMFAFSSYMLSLLLAVIAVWLASKRNVLPKIAGILISVLSMSIYQAYISLTAGLFVALLLFRLTVKGDSVGQVIKDGVLFLVHLIATIAIYYGVLHLLLSVRDTTLNEYAEHMTDTESFGFLKRVKHTYTIFIEEILHGSHGFIPAAMSRILHIVCFAGLGIEMAGWMIRCKNLPQILMSVVLIILLPPAVGAIVLIASSVHALVFFAFVTVYVLFCMVMDARFTSGMRSEALNCAVKNVLTVSMLLIIISNVYTANKVFLRVYLSYENSYSFFTSLVTQIKEDPDFTEGTKLALIGETDQYVYPFEEFTQDGYIVGTHGFDVNDYSRNNFIRYYLGFDAEFASEDEVKELAVTAEFENMNCYPYYGSMQKIGDCLVVKLGAADGQK